MAWEEESVDSGLDLQEAGGGKKPIKLIIMAVSVLVLLGGGWFAYKTFFGGEKKEEQAEEVQDGEEVTPQEENAEGGFLVKFQEFVLNLASDPEDPVYLKATIALEVSTNILQDELNDETDPKLYRAKTRNAIIQILRSKTPTEIRDSTNMIEIQKEIQFRLNSIYKSGKVKTVLFTDFTTN